MHDSAFSAAFDHILAVEGGYVNDPDDPGGETKFGISRRAYPHRDIPGLTEADAREIYHLDYWLLAGCDRLPFALALALFDAAVNHGAYKAIVLLQQTLDVRPDGINGPVTQGAAKNGDQSALLLEFLARRGVFYVDLVKANHSRSKFLKGWLRRLFALQQTILAQAGDDWDWEQPA